jgi:hypothetical protein
MEYYKETDGESVFNGTYFHPKKLKDPAEIAIAFNNFFITITEN